MYNENEKAIWCKRSILDWENTISKAILGKKKEEAMIMELLLTLCL